MVDKLFNPFTLLVGPCLVGYLVWKSTIAVADGGYHLPWWNIILSYIVWLLATRTAKLLPHLWHTPSHIIYVPAFILFGYYFAIMKLYALFTLHETAWGTRAGIGDPTQATAATDAGGIGVNIVQEKAYFDVPNSPTLYSGHQSPYQQPAVQMQSAYDSQAAYGGQSAYARQ
jgi:hypothetical protein